jgi:hypothetical protein
VAVQFHVWIIGDIGQVARAPLRRLGLVESATQRNGKHNVERLMIIVERGAPNDRHFLLL